MTQRIPRHLLEKHFPGDYRMIAAFEDMDNQVEESSAGTTSALAATQAIQDATVLVLSPNETFANERILRLDDGLDMEDDGTFLTIKLKDVARTQDYAVTLIAEGDAELLVPLKGTVMTKESAGLGNFATDAAAAAGGVPLGGFYHNAGAVRVRLV